MLLVVDASQVVDHARTLGVPLDDDGAATLLAFGELLRRRAIPLGLVAAGDAGSLMSRHVLDSLRAVVAVEPSDAVAYDLGSGAGLPGVVVAVARPALRVILVDSRRRRAGFLELAVTDLGLANAEVRHARIEHLSEPVDLCFARALAAAERAWSLARPLLAPRGRLVYFAGRDAGVPERLPGASRIDAVPDPLASGGPLVIMGR